jgi:hypothetical protein
MNSTDLHVAKQDRDLVLPLETAGESSAIIGRRGSGKSHTASVVAEELLEQRCQVVVFDPTNAWYGLRSSASGTEPGYPVIVFGHGQFKDLELDPEYGEMLADFVVDQGRSVVLSMRHFAPEEIWKFVADFAERLYLRKADDHTTVQLICDEADRYVPQNIPKHPEAKRAFKAMDTCVRLGRSSGLGVTLISQRPAVINKDVLTQAHMMVCHQVTGPHDKAALAEWVRANDPDHEKEFFNSLPHLKVGEAWFWKPGDDGFFKRVQVRKRRTFDSSQTPKVGVKRSAPKQLAQVDLDELGARLAETVERQKENDPEHLKKEVRRLRAELEELRAQKLALTAEDVEPLHELAHDAQVDLDSVQTMIGSVRATLAKLVNEAFYLFRGRPVEVAATGETAEPPAPKAVAVAQSVPLPPRPAARPSTQATLAKGEAAVLTVIVEQSHNGGATRGQITYLTGYKRSTRDAYISRLLASGHIVCERDKFVATAGGMVYVPDARTAPRSGSPLYNWWVQRLPAGERSVLQTLEQHRRGLSRDQISQKTGYKRSTRDAYISRLALMELVSKNGTAFVIHARLT